MAEEKQSSRLTFVDVCRGLAVLLMLQTHAYDAWLRPELRETEFFRWSQLIGGLPGAFFLFLLGVSSALGNEKARNRGATPREMLRQGLERAGLLFAFAIAFRLTMYLASDRPDINAVFRVDILNCLALALALLSPVDTLTNRGSRIFAALGTAAWFAIGASFVWDGGMTAGLPERIAGYLSGRVPNTIFPLFPWCAFAFAGHAAGCWIASAREGTIRRVMGQILGLGVVAMPVSMVLDRMETLGPRYDYWWTSPNFVMFKTGVLIILVAACFHFERIRQIAPRILQTSLAAVSAALTQIGRTSLFIYCVHVDMVYGSWALPKLWRSCEIGEASRNLVLFTLAMLLMSYAWSWIKRSLRRATSA